MVAPTLILVVNAGSSSLTLHLLGSDDAVLACSGRPTAPGVGPGRRTLTLTSQGST